MNLIEFFKNKKILLVSKDAQVKKVIIRFLQDQHVSTTQITSLNKFTEAYSASKTESFDVAFSDFYLEGQESAMNLFRELDPECVTLVLSHNTNQAEIAQAAEEELDAILMFPLNQKLLKKVVCHAVSQKNNPSPYMKKNKEAELALLEGRAEDCLKHAKEAMSLSEEPSLACFYYAQAKSYLGDNCEAVAKLMEGLKYNSLHYRCMVGLYELYKKDNKDKEAYDVVKKISHIFPANPDRLAEVIHLAIKTAHFEDIETYYDVFVGLEHRSEKMMKYIYAGMFICAKYYLKERKINASLRVIEKMLTSQAVIEEYLDSIIDLVVREKKLLEFALKSVSKYPPGKKKKAMEFVAESLSLEDGFVAQKGLALFREGVYTKASLRLTILALLMVKKSGDYNDLLKFAKNMDETYFSSHNYLKVA